ncbi:hypothetical protein EDC44_10461 [Cricetibacter osteomyelitidis]|uniref:Uncharacterized protein n=1 Tax=Cricetibacter osteomyelitidis TaxID=1521931 RepID=A0A4R2TH54_9PAST|nr:hypothetical protein [Cricetibacter osteomyelitidis]TCP96528.1 hypothetical protein EDC44_10461 [Cricetibacter osteomyelitidis]
MKFTILLVGIAYLIGCLPIEPAPKGVINIYNFCSSPIELRNVNVSDDFYMNRRGIIIDVNSVEFGIFHSNGNIVLDNFNNYFVENGIKKHFKIDKYSNEIINFIACSENAKPTGDGNWIRAK